MEKCGIFSSIFPSMHDHSKTIVLIGREAEINKIDRIMNFIKTLKQTKLLSAVKISYLILFFCFLTIQVVAQSLYMPRNVAQSYKKGTRSIEGFPGKNYFQNKAKYDLVFDVTPPKKTIKGSGKISYTNNSPDTLPYLMVRLIQNIHKPGALRFNNVPEAYLTNGLVIDELMINGEPKIMESRGLNTLQAVKLSKPLYPKSSVELSVKWHYEISLETPGDLENGREGALDSTTFFMGYAYPRVSVYDDQNGWDMSEFNDIEEFYFDFNDYKVTVNVPSNFIVWGTGTLENPNEVLREPYASKYKNSLSSDAITHILSLSDYKNNTITPKKAVNAWKFSANDIEDVAYTISNHFIWDASSVIVDTKTGRRVSVQAVYNDTARSFKNMVKWTRYSLQWFSGELPGVPYPFPKMTVVQGYADMEFPMMVNGIEHSDSLDTRAVGAGHEVAHSWFPFYMGINETRYPFMDEGWASFLESAITYSYVKKEDALLGDERSAEEWSMNPMDEMDLPIITPSTMMIGEAYQLNAYTKPKLAYYALKDLLGDALFKKCLHAYMDRWHGKHPIPWDFFYTFNSVSQKNLNSFWKAWFFDNNYIDFAINKVEKSTKGYTITLQNIGGIPAPFDVVILYKDGKTEIIHQSPYLWSRSPKNTPLSINTSRLIKSIEIRNGIFTDADPNNNIWEKK